MTDKPLRVLWCTADLARGGIAHYSYDLFNILAGSGIEFHAVYVNDHRLDKKLLNSFPVPYSKYDPKTFDSLVESSSIVSLATMSHYVAESKALIRSASIRPIIAQIHGVCPFSVMLTKEMHEVTNNFVACSPAASECIRANALGASIFCPMMPLDFSRCKRKLSKAEARLRYTDKSGPLVVFAGRISEEKGLIDAAKLTSLSSPETLLLCVGDGFEQNKIHDVMRMYLGDRLITHPWTQDITDYLDAADCFICTSLYEGGPLTVIEALAHGTPVVSKQVGIVPYLNIRREGQLDRRLCVPLESPDDIMRACKIKMPPETDAYLRSIFSPEAIRQQWISWLKTIL